MSVITSLTTKQKELLEVYKKKWTKIALDTSPTREDIVIPTIQKIYANVELKPPKEFYHVSSPKACIEKYLELMPGLKKAQRKSAAEKQIYNFLYGSHAASWLSYYNYFDQVLKVENLEIIRPFVKLAYNCGWWLPYDTCVIYSDKPQEIHFQEGHLHKDGGPAIAYGDGFRVWALNGVRVSQYIAETPGSEIDPTIALKEPNAEVRCEIVRKIGYNNLFESLNGKVLDASKEYIDDKPEYELLQFDNVFSNPMIILKMRCCSTNRDFFIPVDPKCKTIEDALNFYYKDKKYNFIEAS